MQPIDLTENNTPITPDQVEQPVGCGGTCGGKCGSGKKKSCCMAKCCCVVKIVLRIVAAVLLFYAGYLYGKQ